MVAGSGGKSRGAIGRETFWPTHGIDSIVSHAPVKESLEDQETLRSEICAPWALLVDLFSWPPPLPCLFRRAIPDNLVLHRYHRQDVLASHAGRQQFPVYAPGAILWLLRCTCCFHQWSGKRRASPQGTTFHLWVLLRLPFQVDHVGSGLVRRRRRRSALAVRHRSWNARCRRRSITAQA